MKTKLPVIAIFAFLVSACGTGTYMTKTYDDDIYFSPADVPPVSLASNGVSEKSNTDQVKAKEKDAIISQIQENPDGTKTLTNNIYQSDNTGDDRVYNMDDQQLVDSDTTAYYDDEDVKYVINNYYDDNDIDFAYRINRFHRPFFYSPFSNWYWDSYYYSPFYNDYYGYGYGWYDPFYYNWGYPYGLYSYWDPFYFGFSGYWGGYNPWYYDGYYGGHYGGLYATHDVGRRRTTNMTLERGRANSELGGLNARGSDGNRISSLSHDRARSIETSGARSQNKSATLVNDRRGVVSSEGRRSITSTSDPSNGTYIRSGQAVRTSASNQGTVRRTYQPSTTGRTYSQGQAVRSTQNYTPSYNKPRVVNQSSYNNSYNRPRIVNNSNSGSSNVSRTQSYSAPQSSSNVRQVYRSSSTYSTGSSSTPRSSSSYSRSSSDSYSAPSRSSSSSSPSYSGGSSGSYSSGGGSSRSGSSGSSGGSGHRR